MGERWGWNELVNREVWNVSCPPTIPVHQMINESWAICALEKLYREMLLYLLYNILVLWQQISLNPGWIELLNCIQEDVVLEWEQMPFLSSSLFTDFALPPGSNLGQIKEAVSRDCHIYYFLISKYSNPSIFLKYLCKNEIIFKIMLAYWIWAQVHFHLWNIKTKQIMGHCWF